MSYASWVRSQRSRIGRAKVFLGLDVDPPREESPWPTNFERFCPEHDLPLNWLLCPKGHEFSSTDEWVVKDVTTGRVLEVCRANDGTQQWRGYAPR